MSQRTALLISTVLTVLTLLGGVGLAVRVMSANPANPDDIADQQPASADTPSVADADLQVELLDRLEAFNMALSTSYQRIADLLNTVDRLQTQNAELRERELVYQARLAEANKRLETLEHAGAAPGTGVPVASVNGNQDANAQPETISEDALAAGPQTDPVQPVQAAASQALQATSIQVVPAPPEQSAPAQPAPAPVRAAAPPTSAAARSTQPALNSGASRVVPLQPVPAPSQAAQTVSSILTQNGLVTRLTETTAARAAERRKDDDKGKNERSSSRRERDDDDDD